MQVTVRLYASLRSKANGQRQVVVEVPEGAKVIDVADQLAIGDVHTEVMVNDETGHHGLVVHDGDVVSFFPALAGG